MERNAELERVAETMSRADPDFHQRLSARLDGDRMVGKTEMSEDQGTTWRKDFDLTFLRTP